MAFIVNTEGR